MAKIIKLMKDSYSPEDLLNDVKDNLSKIKGLMVVIDYEDESMEVMHSGLSIREMSMAILLMQREALELAMYDNDGEEDA